MARLAMAELAEKTLDGQYYIWDGDTTGLILADRLLRAADRGVRVRLLIDDHYMTEARDASIAALDAHPNIEIRFFNPVRNRRWRIMSFLADFGRVNHRMHNKLFVMDNAVGIVGGRNIADIYFGVRADHNYRDLDVMTAGPIVGELSASFDLFWNSEWAIPVAAVVMWTRASRLVCVTFGSSTIVGVRARWSIAGCGIVAPGSAPRTSVASTSPRTSRSTLEYSPGLNRG